MLAACDSTYTGNTRLYPANVSDYGACGYGMSGPEVVYTLNIGEPLAYLELNFGAAANLRLFLVSGDGSADCLGVAGLGGSLMLPDFAPGTYFIAVDGYMAGAYFFSIHCRAAALTVTPSPTLTRTLTSTPTRTRTPTYTPVSHQVFLPLTMKGGSGWALSR
jgi:hypothetical protein